ncbi:MAG: NusG domain II-containing protein [Clostridiales bacterium]|nr:NusG domain II-containing protein [Clostridiales bacterium]
MSKRGGQSDISDSGRSGSAREKQLDNSKLPARNFSFRKGDFWVIGSIVLLCTIMIAGLAIYGQATRSRSRYVRITQNGRILMERDLQEFQDPVEFRIETDAGHMVIVISSEKVYVKESDCADKICVHAGDLTKIGDGAVCLPNRVVVQIVSGSGDAGSSNGEVDVVAK